MAPINMDHTKKFVLVDPRFVKPSMRDRALSGLDADISKILDSDEPDEVKSRNYVSALSRYKMYSAPPKPSPPPPPADAAVAVPPVVAAVPAVPDVFQFKARSPPKRKSKRVKKESLDSDLSFEPTLWRRTQREQTKNKLGSQWITLDETPKKGKRSTWIKN